MTCFIASALLLLCSVSSIEAFLPLAPQFGATSIGSSRSTTSAFTIVTSKRSSQSSALQLSEDEVIEIAKDYVTNSNGFYRAVDNDKHADDFVFRAGVVGPLNKSDYINTMKKLGIYKNFDLQPNFFGFCVDPEDPLLARFFVRYTGQQVKPFTIDNTPINIPVTTKPVQGPTEVYCVRLNEEGKVQFFSISPPIIHGNPNPTSTGGLGVVLGLINHAGAPAIADVALNDNLRGASNAIARLMGEEIGPPLTKSKPEVLPAWYSEA